MPARRRRGGVLLGALAVALAIAAGIGALRHSGDSDRLTIDQGPPRTRVPGVATRGSVAPPFDLSALTGHDRVSLASTRGHPVIVNFWASWCGSCRQEFPVLRTLAHDHPEVRVIGITFRDLPSDSRAFARDQHATWTLAQGGDDDRVGRAYGVRAIPQTFFIDRGGVIRARAFGLPSTAALDAVVTRISR